MKEKIKQEIWAELQEEAFSPADFRNEISEEIAERAIQKTIEWKDNEFMTNLDTLLKTFRSKKSQEELKRIIQPIIEKAVEQERQKTAEAIFDELDKMFLSYRKEERDKLKKEFGCGK